VVVVADAVEERAEELVRLAVDSVRNLLWPPLLRGATRPGVDVEAWCPPGGRQASVGWGPTTPAIPLRTVAWQARN